MSRSRHMAGMLPLLLVLTWGGTGRAEQPLEVYPGAVHTRIGSELLIGGQLHRMAYFLTDDTPRKVAQHFHARWVAEGLPTTLNVVGPDELVVSSFRTREGLQRSIVLRRHGAKTLGVTVLKDLWLDVKRPAAPLQALENTLLSSDMAARDDGGHTQHRSLVVRGTLAGVGEELSRKLAETGFSKVRESRMKDVDGVRLTLQHARAGEQMVSVVSELDATTVAVLQTWVGSDRPDGVANDAALKTLRAGETP